MRQRQPSMPRPTAPQRLAQQHARNLIESLGRLYRKPLASLLTVSVIGITLALPAGLHVLLKNLDALSYSWQGTLQASLFLQDDVDEAAGRTLSKQLAQHQGVAKTRYISRAQALAEFRKLSGFGDALSALDSNPLPAVIVVQPNPSLDANAITQLVKALGEHQEVAQAQLDQAWLQRLYAVLAIVQRGVTIIAVLLAFAVIFIVGNTIRLDIENRRAEIEVMKLLGASDSFIRRPFLYSGFWYGLLGGLFAWLLLGVCMFAIGGPVQHLASLYDSDVDLLGLSARATLYLLGAGILLGWLGSAVSVSRRLHAIQPR